MFKPVLGIVLVAGVLASCASEPRPTVSAQQPLREPVAEFMAEQAYLRRQLEGGNPRTFDAAEWAAFEVIQTRFSRLLADVEDASQLSAGARRQLYDTRYQLMLLLVGDDDLICMDRSPPTGTRIAPRRQCIHRDRLQDEAYATEVWRLMYDAAPQRHD